MKSVLLTDYGPGFGAVEVIERNVPEPKNGEVLVKVTASPINPSDLMFMTGRYGFKKRLPVVPGFEASGTVVASGGGLLARLWMGRRVAFAVQATGDGTWAEYAVASAAHCLPLRNDVTFEQGAMMLVNPFTAWALMSIARERGAKTVLSTAAGSSLGSMIWRLGKEQGVDVVGIVRRTEQAVELKARGMEVLCAADAKFEQELSVLCRREKIKLAFDAVGGETTARLAKALDIGGQVIVYGGLSLKDASLSLDDLIFRSKSVEGFWLSQWFANKGLGVILTDAPKVQKLIGTVLASEVRRTYPLDDAVAALSDYTAAMSGGKILFVP
jgi:NADPH:quinone reductase-like Zn-dependent oxidoreductase